MVTNIERAVHYRFLRCTENIAIVSESIAEDPNVTLPRRSQELVLPYGTLWRILPLDLHLYLYNVHLTQQLKPADRLQCRKYVKFVVEQQAVDGNISKKIFFSYESLFTLCGYVKKQNYRIWSSEDPQVIEERPLYPEKVPV